jgi:hypothetical protein
MLDEIHDWISILTTISNPKIGENMKSQQNHNSSECPIIVHRLIPAAVVRRLHNDITRHKKAKKTLRRMKKEQRDE